MSTCRDEILEVARALVARNGEGTFTADQVVAEMRKRRTSFKESTIRTHVTSRMCASAPNHHARVFDDFERVGRGIYRFRNNAPMDDGRTASRRERQSRAPRPASPVVTDSIAAAAPTGSPTRIGLVGCVKAKLDHAAPAADLYVSTLFRGRRTYVERTCERWFILSALYGLVRPSVLLEPYDVALNKASRAHRRTWATSVLSQLDAELGSCAGLTFEIHAGSSYADYGLVDGLMARGAVVERPCAGLSMGQQLAFYAEPHAAGTAARSIPRTTAPQCQECDVRAAIDDLDESPSPVPACDWPAGLACLEQPGLYVWWVDDQARPISRAASASRSRQGASTQGKLERPSGRRARTRTTRWASASASCILAGRCAGPPSVTRSLPSSVSSSECRSRRQCASRQLPRRRSRHGCASTSASLCTLTRIATR